jgi:diazepam-binding inhibitor (GABA receptor modulating acyl-CoA-binding protein)
MSNSPQFLQAVDAIHELNTKPPTNVLLQLYGLYKQATIGDIDNSQVIKPGLLDFKGNIKWNSWNNYKGYSKYQAEVEYIKLVNILITND